MKIYNHKHKDRAVLELEENELTLFAMLLEKSTLNPKNIINKPLVSEMNKVTQSFINA